MITALTLCGYLASAHLATACRATKDPHGATMTLQSTGQPAMLVFNPEVGATDVIAPALEAAGGHIVRGDWAGVVIATKGEVPEGVTAWVQTLDAAVQYTAAVRQDTAHLRLSKAAGNIVGQVTWGERLGEDREQLLAVTASWKDVTGRALPAMPVRVVE